IADGPVVRLDGDLLHASAESLDAYIAKQNRYTSLQAAALHARGNRAGALHLALSPLARFVRFYVLKLGFLDGAAGFAHIAIGAQSEFTFARVDLADADATAQLFGDGNFDSVVHLAAQPGVRYSLVNPGAYVRNNLVAFGHVLEECRRAHVAHLVYASSSSVYGANHTLPFSEDQP